MMIFSNCYVIALLLLSKYVASEERQGSGGMEIELPELSENVGTKVFASTEFITASIKNDSVKKTVKIFLRGKDISELTTDNFYTYCHLPHVILLVSTSFKNVITVNFSISSGTFPELYDIYFMHLGVKCHIFHDDDVYTFYISSENDGSVMLPGKHNSEFRVISYPVKTAVHFIIILSLIVIIYLIVLVMIPVITLKLKKKEK